MSQPNKCVICGVADIKPGTKYCDLCDGYVHQIRADKSEPGQYWRNRHRDVMELLTLLEFQPEPDEQRIRHYQKLLRMCEAQLCIP